jgi:lysozyme family protein
MSIVAHINALRRPVVELGARGPIVTDIQKALIRGGYYKFKLDDKYGIKTDAAVRAFQLDNHVSVDGDVGSVTGSLLDKLLGVETSITIPVARASGVLQTFPYQNEYTILWQSIALKQSRIKEIDRVIAKLRDLARWKEYLRLFEATGVPPQVTAVIHERECGANLKGVLHNGELIVGTGRKTKLVPAGRGPFATFHAAGLDAYRKEGLDTFDWHAGGPARCAYALEKFNGFGYRKQGIKSPYLWAATDHYTRGKYIRDGVFSATHVDTQIGGMAILRRMMDLDASLKF